MEQLAHFRLVAHQDKTVINMQILRQYCGETRSSTRHVLAALFLRMMSYIGGWPLGFGLLARGVLSLAPLGLPLGATIIVL